MKDKDYIHHKWIRYTGAIGWTIWTAAIIYYAVMHWPSLESMVEVQPTMILAAFGAGVALSSVFILGTWNTHVEQKTGASADE